MIAEIPAELESNLHDEIVAEKYISVMADGATDKGILENEAICESTRGRETQGLPGYNTPVRRLIQRGRFTE